MSVLRCPCAPSPLLPRSLVDPGTTTIKSSFPKFKFKGKKKEERRIKKIGKNSFPSSTFKETHVKSSGTLQSASYRSVQMRLASDLTSHPPCDKRFHRRWAWHQHEATNKTTHIQKKKKKILQNGI